MLRSGSRTASCSPPPSGVQAAWRAAIGSSGTISMGWPRSTRRCRAPACWSPTAGEHGRRAGCRQGRPCRNEAQTPSARWPCSRACRKASPRPGRRASRSSCCQEIRPARPYRSASSSRRPWTPSKVFHLNRPRPPVPSSPRRCSRRRQEILPHRDSRCSGADGHARDRPGIPPAHGTGQSEHADHRPGHVAGLTVGDAVRRTSVWRQRRSRQQHRETPRLTRRTRRAARIPVRQVPQSP